MIFNEVKEIAGITEQWQDTLKTNKGLIFEIYKNPTHKEFTQLKVDGVDHFRYIVSLYGKEKVIYVFNSNLLHYDAAKKLNIPYRMRYPIPVCGDYGFGLSRLVDGKLLLDPGIKKEIKKMGEKSFDMEFLRRYFANI